MAVSIAKLEFYNNLRKSADVGEDGLTTVFPAGFVHLPKIDAEFIQQLCAEQLITAATATASRCVSGKRCVSAMGRSTATSTPARLHRRRVWIASRNVTGGNWSDNWGQPVRQP